MDYREIIRIDPERRFGKPCVRDTRISVFDVLSWLASGMTHAEILEDFRSYIGKFWLVKPKAADLESLVLTLRRAA